VRRQARRETDVSDTFLDSAWYFLRYPSAGRADVAFDPALTAKWLPVNSYIGGNEHAVLHLLYSRFVTMVLHDMGYLDFEEPFTQFRAHGLIIKDGAKMSKSKGNIINPDEYIDRWGADAFRTYLMFLGPFEQGGDFRSSGISGVRRFLDRPLGERGRGDRGRRRVGACARPRTRRVTRRGRRLATRPSSASSTRRSRRSPRTSRGCRTTRRSRR
jgi:leucyl-tRNA synthetase